MAAILVLKTENGKTIKVYRKSETDEWVVKFYNSQGVHMDASDSFHNDKLDAIDTACYAQRRENEELRVYNHTTTDMQEMCHGQ